MTSVFNQSQLERGKTYSLHKGFGFGSVDNRFFKAHRESSAKAHVAEPRLNPSQKAEKLIAELASLSEKLKLLPADHYKSDTPHQIILDAWAKFKALDAQIFDLTKWKPKLFTDLFNALEQTEKAIMQEYAPYLIANHLNSVRSTLKENCSNRDDTGKAWFIFENVRESVSDSEKRANELMGGDEGNPKFARIIQALSEAKEAVEEYRTLLNEAQTSRKRGAGSISAIGKAYNYDDYRIARADLFRETLRNDEVAHITRDVEGNII